MGAASSILFFNANVFTTNARLEHSNVLKRRKKRPVNTRARAVRFRILCTDVIDADLNVFFGERIMMLSCQWFATVE